MVEQACISSDVTGRHRATHALFCLFVAMIACPASLAAKSPGTRTQIVAPRSLKVEAPGQINFDIRVVAPRGVVPNYSIVIRGLPPSVKLSAGEAIGSDTWKVPVLELADLKMTLMAGAVGTSELEFTLVTSRNVVLARASSELIVERPAVMETLPARGAAEQAEKSSQDPLSRHAGRPRRQGKPKKLRGSRGRRKRGKPRKPGSSKKRARLLRPSRRGKPRRRDKLAEAKAEEARKAEEAEKLAEPRQRKRGKLKRQGRPRRRGSSPKPPGPRRRGKLKRQESRGGEKARRSRGRGSKESRGS